MSFEQDLLELLNPLAGNRVFWDASPEGARITQATILIEGAGGRDRSWYVEKKLGDTAHARVRITVISPDKQEACDLSRQVERTICESAFDAQSMGAFSGQYVAALKLYENRQDFGILYADPDPV